MRGDLQEGGAVMKPMIARSHLRRNLPKGAEYYTIFPVYCKKITDIRQQLLGIVDFENDNYIKRKEEEE